MLINCPHCGKSVSDTAKACIHCGFVINGESKTKEMKESISINKKDYEDLTADEQDKYMSQFKQEDPTQYNVINAEKIRLILSLIVGGVAILLSIVGLIILITIGRNRLDVADPSLIDFIIALGPLAVGLLCWFIFSIISVLSKINRQKVIIAYNHYEKFLNKNNVKGFADLMVDNSTEREKLENLDV